MDLKRIYIYHITSVENLSGILANRGLWSDLEREARGVANKNIAHSHIKERRRNTLVPVGPRGVVADYVPFYYCTRSPMLYAIHSGNVSGYADGQKSVVHLCSTVEIAHKNIQWCSSTGHTDITSLCTFFDTVDGFSSLDWNAIGSKSWGFPHFTQDSDLKRRKQAEFLAYRFFPWELFIGIGVFDEEVLQTVQSILEPATRKPRIAVTRNWYY
ncbi:DUF4433 domain-containing protein [Desulfovibrio sp. OttesenSCG-928-C14]|nr:DUF4433 domain-containing protein [Desulfovibrio sp. OttesenSCG-928-C14]